MMKLLNPHNAEELFIDLGVAANRAGECGLSLAEMEAADAYLAGTHHLKGNVALVLRDGHQFVVWLDKPAKHPPLFIEEKGGRRDGHRSSKQ